MSKIWEKTEGGLPKYLVVRRDGTVPAWPWFVLGARDPAAPRALIAYAAEVERLGMDPEYAKSVCELAEDFSKYCASKNVVYGNPSAGPDRRESPQVVQALEGNVTVMNVLPDIRVTDVPLEDPSGQRPEPYQKPSRAEAEGYLSLAEIMAQRAAVHGNGDYFPFPDPLTPAEPFTVLPHRTDIEVFLGQYFSAWDDTTLRQVSRSLLVTIVQDALRTYGVATPAAEQPKPNPADLLTPGSVWRHRDGWNTVVQLLCTIGPGGIDAVVAADNSQAMRSKDPSPLVTYGRTGFLEMFTHAGIAPRNPIPAPGQLWRRKGTTAEVEVKRISNMLRDTPAVIYGPANGADNVAVAQTVFVSDFEFTGRRAGDD